MQVLLENPNLDIALMILAFIVILITATVLIPKAVIAAEGWLYRRDFRKNKMPKITSWRDELGRTICVVKNLPKEIA